jgi:DNA invertase Pin-like site-specific DNA recombinase
MTESGRSVAREHVVHRRAVFAIGYVGTVSAGRTDDADMKQQAELIERCCGDRGWTLRKLIWEVNLHEGSGGGRRPALDYALRRLETEQTSRLVVARLETLSHSIAELGSVLTELQRRGGHLLCIDPEIDTDNEAGETVLRALIAVSNRERERLAERTRKGLVTARSKRALSRPAVEDRPELQQRILAMRASGMTLQAIADKLNADGVPTLRGGARWRPSSVHATTGYKRRENGPSGWPQPGGRR